jgi:hypothetical protein
LVVIQLKPDLAKQTLQTLMNLKRERPKRWFCKGVRVCL